MVRLFINGERVDPLDPATIEYALNFIYDTLDIDEPSQRRQPWYDEGMTLLLLPLTIF